jgi:phage shock protein C
MFCSSCGKQVPANAAFCANCGGAQPGNATTRRVTRPVVGRKIGGVCLGIANYLQVDPTLVRVITVLLALIPPFPAVLVYLIAWFVMPAEELHMAPPPTSTGYVPGAQSNTTNL